jgi:peptidoglycan hydrolase CwlO-like protein
LLVFLTANPIFAETTAERKARLEKELQTVERQILKQQVLVENTQLQQQSLERDINLIDEQIKEAKLGIQARDVAIQQIGDQIVDKQGVINVLDDRLQRQRQSLGQLLRKTQEIDDYSLADIMLGGQNLSSFFDDLENYQSIKSSLNQSLDVLKQIKTDTEDQKTSLEDKQISESKLKRLQEVEKKNIEDKQSQKQNILEVTKGQEAEYEKLLESQQKTAAQIKAELFALAGGGAKIPLPQAISLAQFASRQTGVSPSLILAILQQESEFGSNIGSCSYDDLVQGKEVMSPDRDQPVFLEMAKVLGFDPHRQQISCPWIRSGTRIGWGGAMGPSQFIPSTWALYGGFVNNGGWQYDKSKDAIRSLTGKTSPSSPFNNQDAFMATALLLRDNGASGGGYKAEWTAAIRYFAGWAGPSDPINFPYGDNVMKNKAYYDSAIKTLQNG